MPASGSGPIFQPGEATCRGSGFYLGTRSTDHKAAVAKNLCRQSALGTVAGSDLRLMAIRLLLYPSRRVSFRSGRTRVSEVRFHRSNCRLSCCSVPTRLATHCGPHLFPPFQPSSSAQRYIPWRLLGAVQHGSNALSCRMPTTDFSVANMNHKPCWCCVPVSNPG